MVEFDHFRKEAGLPTFTMNVSNWIENTNAIGIVAKAGRYGGTYAQQSELHHTHRCCQGVYHSSIDEKNQSSAYASEADLLNIALWGCKAAQWCDAKMAAEQLAHLNAIEAEK